MTNFYADRFYKNADGEYFTGEYLKNHYQIDASQAANKGYKDIQLHAKNWDEFNQELTGKRVYCNYTQIFYHDSNMILCNELPNAFPEMWEYIENGSDYDEENDEYTEIYQYYIIDPGTAERLKEHTDEIIFYVEKLDIYVLGVTHWGTGWDYCTAEFIY
jgi:hypothetical protein